MHHEDVRKIFVRDELFKLWKVLDRVGITRGYCSPRLLLGSYRGCSILLRVFSAVIGGILLLGNPIGINHIDVFTFCGWLSSANRLRSDGINHRCVARILCCGRAAGRRNSHFTRRVLRGRYVYAQAGGLGNEVDALSGLVHDREQSQEEVRIDVHDLVFEVLAPDIVVELAFHILRALRSVREEWPAADLLRIVGTLPKDPDHLCRYDRLGVAHPAVRRPAGLHMLALASLVGFVEGRRSLPVLAEELQDRPGSNQARLDERLVPLLVVIALAVLLDHAARPDGEGVRARDALDPEDVSELMAPDEAIRCAEARRCAVATEDRAIRVALPPEANVALAFRSWFGRHVRWLRIWGCRTKELVVGVREQGVDQLDAWQTRSLYTVTKVTFDRCSPVPHGPGSTLGGAVPHGQSAKDRVALSTSRSW